jgi:hypothetical protein
MHAECGCFLRANDVWRRERDRSNRRARKERTSIHDETLPLSTNYPLFFGAV